MTAAFLAGVIAGYGVAVPVGAIAILIIGLTARYGPRVGVAAATAVATADGFYAGIAVVGGAALAGLIAPLAGPLRLTAAVILVGIAASTAFSALRQHRAAHRDGSDGSVGTGGPLPIRSSDDRGPVGVGVRLGRPIPAYLGVLGLTLLNPMTIVCFGALVLAREASDGLSPPGEAIFVLGAFLASASWQLLLVAGGSVVGRLLTGLRGRLFTALAASLLITVLALHLLSG